MLQFSRFVGNDYKIIRPYLRWLIFAWKQSVEQTKISPLHGIKIKISFDAMKLSPFCKFLLMAKSIGSLMIYIIY